MRRAKVGDGPERREHRFSAFCLDRTGQRFDLAAVGTAAEGGVAGGERDQLDIGKIECRRSAQFLERQKFAVAEKQIRI